MIFGKKVTQSVRLSNNSLIVIPILKNNLFPSSKQLVNYETDPNIIKNYGLRCDPEDLMRMLYTMFHVVHKPYLGLPQYDNKEVDEDTLSHCFAINNETHADILSVYIEFIYGEEYIHVGWRIFIVIASPQFNMDRGLLNFFKEERARLEEERKSRRVRKEKLVPIQPIYKKKDWIDDGISPFLGEALNLVSNNDDYNTQGNLAHSRGLDAPNNPAGCVRIFTFARSCEVFKGIALNIYLDENSYMSVAAAAADPNQDPESSDDDPDEGGDEDADEAEAILDRRAVVVVNQAASFIRFPEKAYLIPHLNRHPDELFTADLSREPDDSTFASNDDNAKERRLHAKQITSKKADNDAVLHSAIAWWEEHTKGKNPQAVNQLRCTKHAEEMFQSVCRNYKGNPGGCAGSTWLLDKIRQEPDWAPCKEVDMVMDNTLSDFGNLMAAELYRTELICGIGVMHAELLIAMLMTLTLADIDHDEMMFHMLLLGAPGSGKSYILNLIATWLCIKSLIQNVGSFSKKANTTNTVTNGLYQLADELSDLFTESSKYTGGDPMAKTLLTKGRSKDIICHVGDDGVKRDVVTDIEKKVTTLANTNSRPDQLPDGIADRFYLKHAPVQRREGFDPVVEMYRLQTDPKRRAYIEKHGERWQFYQAVAAMVFVMIACKQFPPIDMSLAVTVSSKIIGILSERHNIDVRSRDRSRVVWLTKMCVIFDAITTTWFSGKVFPPNTPFRVSQLNSLLPYLCSRREHYYFALTMMDDIITDPSIPIILKAFQSIVLEEPNPERRFGYNTVNTRIVRTPAKEGESPAPKAIKPDYNYYAIPIGNMGVTDDGKALYHIGNMIRETIRMVSPFDYPSSYIVSVLKKLLIQKQGGQEYTDEKTKGSKTAVLSTAMLKRTPTGYSFEIDRRFMEEILVNKLDIVAKAIEDTIDKDFPVKKILLGRTYRSGWESKGRKIVAPFIFHTLDVSDAINAAKTIELEKHTFVRFGEEFLLNHKGECTSVDATESRLEAVSGCMENDAMKRWCEKNGVPIPVHKVDDTRPCLGSYPIKIMEGYEKEFSSSKRTSTRTEDPSAKKVCTTTTTTTSKKKKKKDVDSDDEFNE